MKHLYNYYKAGNEPLRTNSFCVFVKAVNFIL